MDNSVLVKRLLLARWRIRELLKRLEHREMLEDHRKWIEAKSREGKPGFYSKNGCHLAIY